MPHGRRMGSKFPVYTLRATSPELLRRGDDASRVLMHELDMMRDTRTRWRPKFHEYQPLNAPWVLLSAAARDVSTRGVDTRPWHTPWPDVLCGAPSSPLPLLRACPDGPCGLGSRIPGCLAGVRDIAAFRAAVHRCSRGCKPPPERQRRLACAVAWSAWLRLPVVGDSRGLHPRGRWWNGRRVYWRF